MKTTFNDFLNESTKDKTIIFKHKNNPNMIIKITCDLSGVIKNIEKTIQSIKFPYKIGERMTQNIDSWCCNNNYLMNNKDTCPENKRFGMKKSDILDGPNWKIILPNTTTNQFNP